MWHTFSSLGIWEGWNCSPYLYSYTVSLYRAQSVQLYQVASVVWKKWVTLSSLNALEQNHALLVNWWACDTHGNTVVHHLFWKRTMSGSMSCHCHLILKNNFIFKFMLCKPGPMGQWNRETQNMNALVFFFLSQCYLISVIAHEPRMLVDICMKV
jgi:hypothetical protein